MAFLPSRRQEEGSAMSTLQREMNRLFDDFFAGFPAMRPFGWSEREMFIPPVDVRETDDKVLIDAELPGMDPKDVQVRIEGNSLILSGERKQEKEEKAKGYQRMERSFGRFEREIPLPMSVDSAKCAANYKNGVLQIELPKKPEAKPKTIQVQVK